MRRIDCLQFVFKNFSYHHLLTPVDQVDLTSNSQSYSLCDVIEGQHKFLRTPINRSSPVFPFHNFYIENFCAAKALQRIDQLTQMDNDVNEESLFSLEYESFPANRSAHQLFIEPVTITEYQKNIGQIEKPIDKATPIALNEHKYSKKINFSKKLPPIPQPSVPATKSIKPSSFVSSQIASQKDMSAQDFYNHLQEVPMTSAENKDRLATNPSMNFNNWNSSNDWYPSNDYFDTNRRSQIGYGGSPFHHGEEFIPSQSEFRW